MAVRVGKPDASLRDPFIGRRDQLASLVSLFHATGATTQAALITSEAGVGKSRLVKEFLTWARQNGARVLKGNCYETQDIQPYFPFLQVIDQLRLRRSGARTTLREIADDTIRNSTVLTAPGALVSETQSARTAFLRALCEAILSTPGDSDTVLCVEDVHWADEESLLLLNYLLDLELSGLLLICTARLDETRSSRSRQLLSRLAEKSAEIPLRGLSLPELKELVLARTGPSTVTGDELRDLHDFTGGNPLLARELLAVLSEDGLLRQFTLVEALQESRIPFRVSFVLDMKIEALGARVLRTLAAAAALGMEFTTEFLAQILDANVDEVENNLRLASAQGVVEEVNPIGERRYRFAHPLYRVRVYDRIKPAEQRALHRRAAESGEAYLSVDELALHFVKGFGAKRSEQAVAHCRRAAEDAEGLLAYDSAARFWRLALSCAKSVSKETRSDLLTHLGWALWAATKWDDAINAWTEAIALHEEMGDWRQVEMLALALGETHRVRSEPAPAQQWLKRALSLPAEHAAHRAQALALLAGVHALRGERSAATPLLREATDLLDGNDDPAVLFWLAHSHMARGERTAADALARRGLREAKRREAKTWMVMFAGNLVVQELSRLRLKTARSYARLVERAAQPGNAMAFQRAMFCKAWLLAYEGNWPGLEDLAIQWVAQARFSGEFQVASARMCLGEALLSRGDLAAARQCIEDALPHLAQMMPTAAMSLARLCLMEGDAPGAQRFVHQFAATLLRDTRMSAAAGRAALAEVAAELDEPRLWTACYDALKKEEWPLVIANSPVSVNRVLGRLSTRMRKWDEASAFFNKAISELETGGATWELGRSFADSAAMLRVRRRRGDLDKAAALEERSNTIMHRVPTLQFSDPVPAASASCAVLTGRQLEVLELVAVGHSNADIAATLTLSSRTVARHMEEILRRLRVRSRAEAAAKAIADGLIEPPRSKQTPIKF